MSDTERRYRRTLLEKIKCRLGFHDYGEPHVMETKLAFSATKTEDGMDVDYDESPDPNAYVNQVCQHPRCHGSRKRPDLNVDEHRYDDTGTERD